MAIILIHGYARSGKTTLLSELKKQGYVTISTSLELEMLVLESFRLPRYFLDILRDKDDEALKACLKVENSKEWMSFFDEEQQEEWFPGGSDGLTCRQLKTYLAEKLFVPRYGREKLVELAMRNQFNLTIDSRGLIFFETIGGEEAAFIENRWGCGFGKVIKVNLRSRFEQPGIDIRQLSDGMDFENKYDNPQVLVEKFLEALNV